MNNNSNSNNDYEKNDTNNRRYKKVLQSEPVYKSVEIRSFPSEQLMVNQHDDDVSLSERSNLINKLLFEKNYGITLPENDRYNICITGDAKSLSDIPWWQKIGSRDVPIKPVSDYHCMSKNHIKIQQVDLRAVLERLHITLQKASCQSEIREDTENEHLSRLYCRSIEETNFVVSFWLLPSDNEYDSIGSVVLIEVDRVAGESIVFHRYYAPLILSAIAGDTKSIEKLITNMNHLPTRQLPQQGILFSAAKLFENAARYNNISATTPYDYESIAINAMDMVSDMILNSERYDVQQLGLESLISMTDSTKSTVAERIAHIILVGDGSYRTNQVRKFIYSFALTGLFAHNLDATARSIGEHHSYKALMVLANSVNFAKESNDLSVFVEFAEQIPNVNSAVERLLDYMKCSQLEPHRAYFAALILKALTHSGIMKYHMFDNTTADIIENAQSVGTCGHAALAEASRQLLNELSLVELKV